MCGANLVDENFGRAIGRYVMRQRIGTGSLGKVYRGEQKATGRKLAIKLLPPSQQRDPMVVERFTREANVLTQLRSQHTITIYDFDREADGTLYIAMELVEGRSLAQVLRHEGPQPWPRVMRILVGLCESLGEAHAIGVIHRNLKPENILLEERATNREFVRVSDFGLAKLLTANLKLSPVGQNVGAIEFASPEHLLDRPIDARADLYGMGVLAFLLITGSHPFASARTFGDMVAAHINTPAPRVSSRRSDVPPEVDSLIGTLLQKDPNRRYPDAQTLSAQLGLLLAGIPPEPGATIRTDPEIDIGTEDTAVGETPTKP